MTQISCYVINSPPSLGRLAVKKSITIISSVFSYPPYSQNYISFKECRTFMSQSVVVVLPFLSSLHIIFIWKALPAKGYDLNQLCINLSPSLSLYLPIRPSEYLYLCSNQTDARLTTTTSSTTLIGSTKTKISVHG